jgi:parvulin-like peptidyl-prolyl isomerase
MAKKEVQPARTPTRKQLLVSKREQEQLRIIYWALALVGVLVLIVLGVGLVQTYILEPRSPVAIINGEELTTQAYQDRVRYERFILDREIDEALQRQAALPEAAEADQLTQLIRSQYQQMTNQLLQQRSLVDRQSLDDMIEDELVEAEAARRNITVSEEEITEHINRILASRAGGLTEEAASATSTARAEASATAASWTPTPTFTPSPTMTATETITATETVTESTPTPIDTPTPAPTPTLNIIDEGTLSTQYSEWIAALAEETGITEAQYRQYIRATLLRNKLREALGEEVPTTAEQAHARHLLVETEEEAQQLIERLEAGEAFTDLMTEFTTDESNTTQGSDLGFVPRGEFVPEVEEVIFSLPIGEISEPVQSQFGWHVIEVLEREEERELSPEFLSRRQAQAYDDWLMSTRQEASIEEFWTPSKAPADSFFEQQF